VLSDLVYPKTVPLWTDDPCAVRAAGLVF
jgi:hypothetical protein